MPVEIITTKEQRIAKLIKEMKEAGLYITGMEATYDSFPAPVFGDGYSRKVAGHRRISATIQLEAVDEEGAALLQVWLSQTPHYKVYRS